MHNKKELEKILPHKGDAILIDGVLDYNLADGELTSYVNITENSRFFNKEVNLVPIWVGMEYMAQSIGALSGIYAQTENKPVELGFVIGTRDYECFASGFQNEDYLEVKIKQLFFDSNLGSFDCVILKNKRELVKAQLNVFKQN